MLKRLDEHFYLRDVLEVAPDLLGKLLVRQYENGEKNFYLITETEAYKGEEDLACHASKGRTARTEIMYHRGGYVYVYLIYGMYWMLNIVTGNANCAQAVLIRGLYGINGPGKITRKLNIDKSFYGEDLLKSQRLYICASEDINAITLNYISLPRVGIDYAGDYWKNVPWRFMVKQIPEKVLLTIASLNANKSYNLKDFLD